MERAWEDILANNSSSSVGGVSLSRWVRNWEANIERLGEQVRTNTYRPSRPKRFRVAKRGGGFRELSILTVSDKVLQRAVLNIIDDLFEQRFLKCSHGYRPNRSVATAAQQVIHLREKGNHWVLDADISACFDSIDHAILFSLIRRVISDWFVLRLTELWLQVGRKHRRQAVGIPLGGVISPLWCNIYLHQLDAYLSSRRWNLVRYADDFVVMVPSKEMAKRAKAVAQDRLAALKLSLHKEKTRLVSFEEGFTFLGVDYLGDSYSYICQDKRIEVQGKSVKALWQYTPSFY